MMSQIKDILNSRILVLDGAMGTMVQRLNLTEEQYRGERFKNRETSQIGNIDLLTLSKPEIIRNIHLKYLEVGADVIKTNTFNATSISMEKYGMQSFVREMNIEAAGIAHKAANEFTENNPSKPRFVAGSVGPTDKTTSIIQTKDQSNSITFDELRVSYEEQIEALIDGGVDLVLFETIIDVHNLKAGLLAAQNIFQKRAKEVPIMVSITLADKEGITFSEETIEEFLFSISNTNLLSLGFNCSEASTMKPHLKELKRVSNHYISVHPNAGLPNQLGEYDETPGDIASYIKGYINEGLVNIIGGCCGTTPQHIAKIVKIVDSETSPPTPQYGSNQS